MGSNPSQGGGGASMPSYGGGYSSFIPNISNLARNAGQMQTGINQALTSNGGGPNITDLVRQVGQNQGMQQQAMGGMGSQGVAQGGGPWVSNFPWQPQSSTGYGPAGSGQGRK